MAMNNQSIAFVHCIENKHQRMYERQAWLYLETFRHTNPELYAQTAHYFLQPTQYDIDNITLKYLDSVGAKFNREPELNTGQRNTAVNYTNICVTTEYYSRNATEDYLCWTDTDVLWLNTVPADWFKPTDKPVINIFPLTNQPTKNYSLKEYDAFDTRYQLDEIYQLHFKPYIDQKYQVPNLLYYANTWFVYARRNDPFWQEWRDLTFHLLSAIQSNDNEYITHHVECYCEEIAASIMYTQNPDRFTLLEEFFGPRFVMSETGLDSYDVWTEDKLLYHYTSLQEKPYDIIDESQPPSRLVMEFLGLVRKLGWIDTTEYARLNRNYVLAGNRQ